MESLVDMRIAEKTVQAPIALFVYNRLPHLQKTLAALSANEEAASSLLYIFSDAPKNPADEKAVSEVRRYIRDISGFSAVHIIEREKNYGLAQSIIDGVSKVSGEHGRVVVLEDDIVVSLYFLKYMNDALAMYENDERVISVHGYQYPITAPLPATFFLKGADCWGWATWKRGWDLFEADGSVLLRELKQRKLTYAFDFDGSYPYTRMLKNQIKARNNSWAIRWYASAYLKNRFTLYPGRSLALNIGMDSTGTHCSTTDAFTGDIADSPVKVDPIEIEENAFARTQIAGFFKKTRPYLPIRIMRKVANAIQRIR
ncbi:MAG: hypothetical protein JWQ21_3025 [Herminiimonas sp.]|nr:hypothetical protein [Herminiimonas sp.]